MNFMLLPIDVAISIRQSDTVSAEHDAAQVAPLVGADFVSKVNVLGNVLRVKDTQLFVRFVPSAFFEQRRPRQGNSASTSLRGAAPRLIQIHLGQRSIVPISTTKARSSPTIFSKLN
jgi:hypothetical protein